jgi:hypothetical protein
MGTLVRRVLRLLDRVLLPKWRAAEASATRRADRAKFAALTKAAGAYAAALAPAADDDADVTAAQARRIAKLTAAFRQRLTGVPDHVLQEAEGRLDAVEAWATSAAARVAQPARPRTPRPRTPARSRAASRSRTPARSRAASRSPRARSRAASRSPRARSRARATSPPRAPSPISKGARHPACTAAEDIKARSLIPPALRRLLNRPDGYHSLEDAAIQWARRRDPATKALRQGGLASEARARADLKRLWDSLVEQHGAVDAAQKFFRRVVGVVPCGYPCAAAVRFPSANDLTIECSLGNAFTKRMSVAQVQAEVVRVAQLLRIPTPALGSALKSNCPARRDDAEADSGAGADRAAARQVTVTLTAAQRVAQDIIANMLMRTVTKGALLWHSVGAGKTCAAVAAAAVMLADGWRVKWFSVASLKNQPLMDAFFVRRCHDLPVPADVAPGDRLRVIKQFMEIHSFSTLGHAFAARPGNAKAAEWLAQARRKNPGYAGSDPLYRTLLVFDEPHKVTQVKGQEVMDWGVVTRALRASYAASGRDSARLLMLDATPMVDGSQHLFTMLNALHPADVLPGTIAAAESAGLLSANGALTPRGQAAFDKAANAVVSYVNLSADRSRFAYGKKWTLNPVALSASQAAAVKNACAKRKGEARRRCAEVTSVSVNMPRRGAAGPNLAELRKRAPDSYPLLTQLVVNIREQDAADRRDHGGTFKHVVFTNVRDVTQVQHIVDVLRASGFEGPGNAVAMLSGSDLTPAERDRVLKAFNAAPGNARGQRQRILVVDGRFREGINLFDVRHFHMLQPLSEYEERQAVGRVLRMCGSTFLPDTDGIWQVRLHLYDAVDSKHDYASIYDILDVRESAKDATTMEQLEDAARDAALDRRLFQAYNVAGAADDYVIKRPPATAHLCKDPPVGGACPPGHVKAANEYGVECCVAPCKGARGKPLPQPVDGKCPKGYVRGASGVDPGSECCYSRGSKAGKAALAAREPGASGAAASVAQSQASASRESQGSRSPPRGSPGSPDTLMEVDEIIAGAPDAVPDAPLQAALDKVESATTAAEMRRALDALDVELGLDGDPSDEARASEARDREARASEARASEARASEARDSGTRAGGSPRRPARVKGACPGRLGGVRADGSCPPGNVSVASPKVAGVRCCKWACGKYKAPRDGRCSPGHRSHTHNGAECCKKA